MEMDSHQAGWAPAVHMPDMSPQSHGGLYLSYLEHQSWPGQVVWDHQQAFTQSMQFQSDETCGLEEDLRPASGAQTPDSFEMPATPSPGYSPLFFAATPPPPLSSIPFGSFAALPPNAAISLSMLPGSMEPDSMKSFFQPQVLPPAPRYNAEERCGVSGTLDSDGGVVAPYSSEGNVGRSVCGDDDFEKEQQQPRQKWRAVDRDSYKNRRNVNTTKTREETESIPSEAEEVLYTGIELEEHVAAEKPVRQQWRAIDPEVATAEKPVRQQWRAVDREAVAAEEPVRQQWRAVGREVQEDAAAEPAKQQWRAVDPQVNGHIKANAASKSSKSSGSRATFSSRDAAAWTRAVRMKDGGRQVRVYMGNWSMSDESMEEWCSWFQDYLRNESSAYRRGQRLCAQEVDFSKNRLTGAGIRRLLQTLSTCDVSVSILKLHHNRLESAYDLSELVADGDVRELHLSHNRLDTFAAAELILAAAGAKDTAGDWRYPWVESDGSSAPLWLRLEQNSVEHKGLLERVNEGVYELERPGRLFCCVDGSRGCTPRCCLACHDPPALHVTYLSSQRLQQAGDYNEWDFPQEYSTQQPQSKQPVKQQEKAWTRSSHKSRRQHWDDRWWQ